MATHSNPNAKRRRKLTPAQWQAVQAWHTAQTLATCLTALKAVRG
jgi:hypothetical protein